MVCATFNLLALALTACSTDDGEDNLHELVILIDRTGVAQADTWQTEVATQTQAALERAFDEGVDDVSLLSIGSDTNQAATVARADLRSIEGNTESKRDAAREDLIEDIYSAAAEVAGQPVETWGTDVFAALHQAASLCHAPAITECSVLVISDLEDQRVLGASSPGAAVDELADLMPDLTGASVQVSGLGASGADAPTVQKIRAAWTELLTHAGAVHVRIARSL